MKAFNHLNLIRVGSVLKDGQFSRASVKYTTSSVVQRSGSTAFFIADLSGVVAGKKAVTVRLPEKATLKNQKRQ